MAAVGTKSGSSWHKSLEFADQQRANVGEGQCRLCAVKTAIGKSPNMKSATAAARPVRDIKREPGEQIIVAPGLLGLGVKETSTGDEQAGRQVGLFQSERDEMDKEQRQRLGHKTQRAERDGDE